MGQKHISAGNVQYSPEGRPKFFNYYKQQGSWTWEAPGRDPEEDTAWFRPFEPRSNISADYPPTFLIHGEKDTDVPVAQAHRLAKELAQNWVDHQLITYPEWEHLFDLNQALDPEVQASLDGVVEFLDQHL